MSTDIHHILKPGVTRMNGFFSVPDIDHRPTLWDELASRDPIDAAVSAHGESEELSKSKRALAVLAAELPRGTVVDLGCGYGRIAKYLLPERAFDLYVGVDSSVVMLNIFHSRYHSRPAEQKTPIALIKSTIDDTLLKDSSVDAVFSCAALLHNPKGVCRAAVGEAFRILKPGGKLLLVDSFPNRVSPVGLIGTLYQAIYRLKGEGDRNGPVRYFSVGEIKRLLSDFSSLTIDRIGFAPLPKSFPFLSIEANNTYRRRIFEPIDRLAARYTPAPVKELFSAYIDATALKPTA